MATYNIVSGRNGHLELALRAMNGLGVDCEILTETKLTNGIHTRQAFGYRVFATEATSHCQGGVALFYRADAPNWHIESERRHGPNVISFRLVTGNRCFGVVGGYIPPTDLSAVGFISQAFDSFPPGMEWIFLGDINVDLADPRDARSAEIAGELSALGLDDMVNHFY